MITEERDELLDTASAWFRNIDIQEGSPAELVQSLWQALVVMPDIEGIVGFIDQTAYANEDNGPAVTWRNDEVLALLTDLRRMLSPEEEER